MPELNRQNARLATDKIRRLTGEKFAEAKRAIINETAFQIAVETPVDTGALRGSWFFSDVPNPIRRKEVIGAASPTLEASGIDSDLDKDIYLVNSRKYAKYVESKQGFVARVLSRTNAITNKVIRDIRGGKR